MFPSNIALIIALFSSICVQCNVEFEYYNCLYIPLSTTAACQAKGDLYFRAGRCIYNLDSMTIVCMNPEVFVTFAETELKKREVIQITFSEASNIRKYFHIAKQFLQKIPDTQWRFLFALYEAINETFWRAGHQALSQISIGLSYFFESQIISFYQRYASEFKTESIPNAIEFHPLDDRAIFTESSVQIAIILSVPHCYDIETASAVSQNMQDHVIPFLRSEIDQLQQFYNNEYNSSYSTSKTLANTTSEVGIYYGCAYSDATYQSFSSHHCALLENSFYSYSQNTTENSNRMHVTVYCHNEMVSVWQGVPYIDLREDLAMLAYHQHDREYEYFFLLDILDSSFQHHNYNNQLLFAESVGMWLLSAIAKLNVEQTPLSTLNNPNRFAITVAGCSHSQQNNRPANSPCIELYPHSITLLRSHFQCVAQAATGLFIKEAHHSVNNYLLIDAYRLFFSASCPFAIVNPTVATKSCNESIVFSQFALWGEEYAKRLSLFRALQLETINNDDSFDSTIPWSWSDVQYQEGDANFLNLRNIFHLTRKDHTSFSSVKIASHINQFHSASNQENDRLDNYEEHQDEAAMRTIKNFLSGRFLSDYALNMIDNNTNLKNYLLSLQAESHKFEVRYPVDSIYQHQSKTNRKERVRATVAVITAIYGNYEKSCKPFARQSVTTDFICFTDTINSTISNGWIVDNIPYHLTALSHDLANNLTHEVNSLYNNQHPFNIAKFYKTNFLSIPKLHEYEVVIWLDGTVRVTSSHMIKEILAIMNNRSITQYNDNRSESNFNFTFTNDILVFEHLGHKTLYEETIISFHCTRYNTTILRGIPQPLQDVNHQYEYYISQGFNDTREYWNSLIRDSGIFISNRTESLPFYGVWITSFVAFKIKVKTKHKDDSESMQTNEKVVRFLNSWATEVRSRTTQDQISFPFIVQKERMYPFPLSYGDYGVYGSATLNSWFVKLGHGI